MKINVNKNLIKKVTAIGTSFVIVGTLSGCNKYELAPVENYNTIRQNQNGNSNLTTSGIQNILNVEGEDFKLIAEYRCNADLNNPNNSSKWLITTDKELYLNVHTKDLPEGYSVYIDNVHIDTSIISDLAVFNGIKQDSMDDRIHNSSLMGFYIDNETSYFGINNIEGMNQEFIQGTFYGCNGYSSGTVEQKRYLESDYREVGVYGNKISIVYDLLVKAPNAKEYKNISVMDKIIVEASPYEKEMAEVEEAKTKRLEKTR